MCNLRISHVKPSAADFAVFRADGSITGGQTRWHGPKHLERNPVLYLAQRRLRAKINVRGLQCTVILALRKLVNSYDTDVSVCSPIPSEVKWKLYASLQLVVNYKNQGSSQCLEGPSEGTFAIVASLMAVCFFLKRADEASWLITFRNPVTLEHLKVTM